MREKINIPKSELETLYLVEKRSPIYISKKFNCTDALIRMRLKEYGIKTRSSQEQAKIDNLREIGVDVTKTYPEKVIPGQPICCAIHGNNCIYRVTEMTFPDLKGCCDYLEKVGHSRGCPPDQCTVYKMKRNT